LDLISWSFRAGAGASEEVSASLLVSEDTAALERFYRYRDGHRTLAVSCLDRIRFETLGVILNSPSTGNDFAKSVVLRATIFVTGAPVLTLESTKLAVQRVPRGLAKHTVSCTAKVNAWRYFATFHTPSWPCT